MKHIGVAIIVSTILVCDLLATKWEVQDFKNWGWYSTTAMVCAFVWFLIAGAKN